VEGEIREEGEARTVRFRIVEGPRVLVESIGFDGAVSIPPAELREQMQTRRPGVLARGLFVEDTLERDLRVLLRFYRARGFADAAVGPAQVGFSEDRTRARLRIPIREGLRRMVRAIAVRGNEAVAAADILAVVPIKAGDPWDQARAEEAARLVERLYARHGYHGARAAPVAVPEGDAVGLTYDITEGEATRIGRILVSGLTLTREHVVRRELPFQVGAPLRADDLAEARRRLAATRLFERVDVEPVRPPATPFADVELILRDARPWRLDLGAGYASEEGVRGFIEVGHDNLFGTGRSISARERVSERGDRTELTYREPWVLDTPWQGELQLFREDREEIGFDTQRSGAAATIVRDIFIERVKGLRAGLRYRIEDFERSNVDRELITEGVTERDDRVASVAPVLTWDRREQPTDPRRGSFHLLAVELGQEWLGGQVDFVKSRLETAWFFDWLPPTVLAASARLGLAWPLGGTERLVIEDRFFAGGSTTVRGYGENRIGPLDSNDNPEGGNAQLILNLEWRFPIWRWLGGVVFADTGTVAPEVEALSLADLHTGVGGGLRITTPIGPIRFDVGYGLRRTEEEKRLHFYLTIGHAF
jgi:outer membrane protein insertion porin family